MKRASSSPAAVLVSAALIALLVFTILGVAKAWRMAGPVHMSIHGYIALGIGLVLTATLAAALIWLAYYSARHGYDDDQGEY